MKEKYIKAKKYYDNKDYVNALKIFSLIDYNDSKTLENDCIDRLEDLIFYSPKKQALKYLEDLKFYSYYNYFIDSYKRRKVDKLAKALMIIPALVGTILLIIIMLF